MRMADGSDTSGHRFNIRCGGHARINPQRPSPPASRLYALVAGGGLSLLGVAGFFYDASFDTGSQLASDDLAGTLLINGWRNVLYLVSGLLALAFAGRAARGRAGARRASTWCSRSGA